MGRSNRFPDLQSPIASTNNAAPLTKESQDVVSVERRDYSLDTCITWAVRIIVIFISVSCVFYREILQNTINSSWLFLQKSWIFNSVYFETWWATFCFAWIIPLYPFAIHFIPSFNKYKIDPSVTYVHQTVLGMLKEAVIYMAPLMFLDTVTVKKYHGVDPSIWKAKQQSVIQHTRALPLDPPELGRVLFDLIASIMTFDVFFFIVHLFFHKNLWLFRNIHAHHHHHDVMHPHVTNKLTVVERIVLILSANFALKLFQSHPLTRMLFVPVFVWLLVENHTGYDLPFGLHRVIPFHLYGGSVKHYKHHIHGSKYYQPFFTYLDLLLESFINSKKIQWKYNGSKEKQ